VASGVASLGAFDLDAVEEVRVAVDELGSTLIAASDGAPITVTFELDAGTLCVDGSTDLVTAAALVVDPLTDRILDAVATSHEWRTEGTTVGCKIEKHVAHRANSTG